MTKQNLVSILVFFAVLMLLLVVYNGLKDRISYRSRVRSRLRAPKGQPIASEAELLDIRQGRSLSAGGGYAISLISLNRLILQSGTSLGLPVIISISLACACATFLAAYFAGLSLFIGAPAAMACGTAVPLILLLAMRSGRQQKFEALLPEAIDTIVRGLRAGHAVSVAISSVALNSGRPRRC